MIFYAVLDKQYFTLSAMPFFHMQEALENVICLSNKYTLTYKNYRTQLFLRREENWEVIDTRLWFRPLGKCMLNAHIHCGDQVICS